MQLRNAVVIFVARQGEAILGARQGFSPGAHVDVPGPGARHVVAQGAANTRNGSTARPAQAPCFSLVIIGADEVSLVVAHIRKRSNGDAGRLVAVRVAVEVTRHNAGDVGTEDMIHDVAAQHIMIAADATRMRFAGAVHQQLHRVEGAGATHEQARRDAPVRLALGVEHLQRQRAPAGFVEDITFSDAVGPDGEVAGGAGVRQGGAQGAVIAGEGATAAAVIAALAGAAAQMRHGQIGVAPGSERAAKAFREHSPHMLFRGVQRKRRQKFSVRPLLEPLGLARHADIVLHFVVPRRNIRVA